MVLHGQSARWGRPHPADRRPKRALALVAIGALCFIAGLGLGIDALSPMFFGGSTIQTLDQTAASTGDTVTVPLIDGHTKQIGSAWFWDGPVNGKAFNMTIPAIGYQAAVLEGVGDAQLVRGPGHYPDSAWPGQPGNVGVAAHNVYWLSFNRLRAGDQVVIQTKLARYVYKITGSKVVSPDDRSILVQGGTEHGLILTTCYPLWAGAYAKQRLVFLAVEVGGVA